MFLALKGATPSVSQGSRVGVMGVSSWFVLAANRVRETGTCSGAKGGSSFVLRLARGTTCSGHQEEGAVLLALIPREFGTVLAQALKALTKIFCSLIVSR